MAKKIVRTEKIKRNGRDAWLTIQEEGAGIHSVHLYNSEHEMDSDSMGGQVLYSGATDGTKALADAVAKYSDKAAAPSAPAAQAPKSPAASSSSSSSSSKKGGMLKSLWNFMTESISTDRTEYTMPDGSPMTGELKEGLEEITSALKSNKINFEVSVGEESVGFKITGNRTKEDRDKKLCTVYGFYPFDAINTNTSDDIAGFLMAFSGNEGEKSVYIAEGSVVPDGALAGLSGFENLRVPYKATIGAHAFEGSPSLQWGYVYDGITSMGEAAFKGCTALHTFFLGDTKVTTVAESLLEGCTELHEITIPKTVKRVESRAFAGCTNLNSVTIKSKDTTFAPDAFADCPNISSVHLPKMTPVEKAALAPVFANTKWGTKPQGGSKTLKIILWAVGILFLLIMLANC